VASSSLRIGSCATVVRRPSIVPYGLAAIHAPSGDPQRTRRAEERSDIAMIATTPQITLMMFS
jgi:hypothetical protein